MHAHPYPGTWMHTTSLRVLSVMFSSLNVDHCVHEHRLYKGRPSLINLFPYTLNLLSIIDDWENISECEARINGLRILDRQQEAEHNSRYLTLLPSCIL